MICKKCRTASPDDLQRCDVCGAPLNRGEIAKKAIGVVTMISILAVCGLYIYFQPDLFGFGNEEEEPVNIETVAIPATKDDTDADLTQKPVTVDLNKEINDVYIMLDEVYNAVNKYFETELSHRPIVSKKGFLYDIESDGLITVHELIEENLLDVKYGNENIFLMYFPPVDLKKYEEVKFSDSKELTIFVGYATKDGIAFSSKTDRGVLYREHYNELIDNYSYEHGEIRRPDITAAEYQAAVTTIISYDFIQDNIFVRYLAMDDKYAVAVVSTEAEPNKLLGYVLENIGEDYSVIFNNFEEYLNFQSEINKQIIDINFDLLPKYNLNAENKNVKRSFPFLTSKLMVDEIITEDDKIMFSSGNDYYAYVVFESGLTILGSYTDNEWKYEEMTNWLAAEMYLTEQEENGAPTYILWQK